MRGAGSKGPSDLEQSPPQQHAVPRAGLNLTLCSNAVCVDGKVLDLRARLWLPSQLWGRAEACVAWSVPCLGLR